MRQLKTNLHFHTREDRDDIGITYSTTEGVRFAAQCGFDVLALTAHEHVLWTPEHAAFARKHGVLLLAGIEKNIGEKHGERGHTVLLNCDKDAENVHTYAELETYRRTHPDIFVIAAHPYYPSLKCHRSRLERYIHLFDAIEHSWFYSAYWNPNRRAAKAAQRFSKPLVATSDTHFFDFFNTDYAVINTREKTPRAVVEALRENRIRNFSRPKRPVREMLIPVGIHTLRNSWAHLQRGRLRI